MSTYKKNSWHRKDKAPKVKKDKWQDHIAVVVFFLFLVFLMYL